MKAERQPHHTPLPREDVVVKNGDDFSESFAKLTIDKSRQSKTNGIIKSETKNERHAVLNYKKDIKIEVKTKEKEVQEVTTKSHVKRENVKEKEKSKSKEEEKPKDKEEQLGELCARGPDRKGLATQSRITATPYAVAHPQRNTSLTNGGLIICNLAQTQLSLGICYPPSICQPRDPALDSYTNHSVPLPNDHSHFTNNITNYPQEVYECPDFQPAVLSPAKPEALSPGKPEGFCPAKSEAQCNLDDSTAIEIIQAVTSDPMRCDLLCQDLQECLQRTNVMSELQNIPETINDQSPYSSYGSLSPASSPQVMPRMSPYPVSFGSPPGPSSPNIPIFSPNIPSPRGGYISDESSNNMYPPPTPPMGKEPCHTPDINLDVIYNEPPEGKRLEEKQIMQELNNSGSQACSTSEVGHQPLSLPSGSVSIVTILPMMIQPMTNSTRGTSRLRSICPKPAVDESPKQSLDNNKVQNTLTQQRHCNIMVNSPRKVVPPVRTAREQFSARCSDEKKKKMTYAKVQACSDEEISHVDEDGDTNLMIFLSNPKEYSHEKIYAMVERCRDIPHVFSIKNKLGHTALYLASVLKNEDPLLPKYIAETMIAVRINLNEADKDGSTIIHALSKEGDTCSKVLNELLSLRDEQGKQCLNVNMDDYEGMSPLHIAVRHHSQEPSLQVVKVLLNHGADVRRKDCKQGSTPLHFAVASDKPDLSLVEILCDAIDEKKGKDSVNMKNRNGDTPLHMAMAYGGCMEQNTLYSILHRLMASGADRADRNQNGKVPLELAPDSYKVDIKKILDKYSIK